MLPNSTRIQFLLAALCSTAILSTSASAEAAGENIALHKKTIFETKPNYAFTTDDGDSLDLTDGRYSSEGELQRIQDSEAIWVQKGTVGWIGVQPAVFTIDLESVQSISGISYSTAAGRAAVTWPTSIYVTVSNDNKEWHYLGELTQLNRKKVPSTDSYNIFRYVVGDLKVKARYVSFGVVQMPFCFVDEIEIYRGADNVDVKKTPAIPPMLQFVRETTNTNLVRNRMNSDIDSIRKQLSERPVPTLQKNTIITKLNRLSSEVAQLPRIATEVKTILPLNNLHREILAVHGEVLALQKTAPLTIWKQHRYAWLPFIARPTASAKPELDISMLKNQFRSDALLLTNASSKPMAVQLSLPKSPRSISASSLKISRTVWTDTTQNVPVPDAMIPLASKNGYYLLEIPAGVTSKLFITANSSRLSAGKHAGTLRISGGTSNNDVPLNISVSPVTMKKPRFSLGMWDYTNGNGAYGITPKNRPAAIKMMREHYVDTPWGNNVVLPNPVAADFDDDGQLVKPLDFTNLKEWVALWPGARRYCVYLGAQNTFAGAAMGTPDFDKRVGSWAKAVANQRRQLGLQQDQLVLLLVDEPQTDEQDAVIAAWAKAIDGQLNLFQDPSWVRPDLTKIQEAITGIDILCPDLSVYKKAGEPVRDYYEKLRQQGKELWFYQCSGPIRLYDPQLYYRHQAWNAFLAGATGQGFWSFGDTGGPATSWHDYAVTRPSSFTPAFIDTSTVYGSVHLEALREGIEDYEELAMLDDFVKQSKNKILSAEASSLLEKSLHSVTSTYDGNYSWQSQKSPDLADDSLQAVRSFLSKTTSVHRTK